MSKKILGIIPARGGSKRVKNKNFKPFAGTTLTDLAIQQALSSKHLDAVLLTSDSVEVLEICNKYKEVIKIDRPINLAKQESPAIDYQTHALEYLKKYTNIRYDWVVIIQPTSPFRAGNDIDATIDLFYSNPKADSAVSVVTVNQMVNPYKFKKMIGNTLVPLLENEEDQTPFHQNPDIYVRNGAVYVFKTSNIKKGIQLGKISVGYVMPDETSHDINTINDFEFAEYHYLNSKVNHIK